MKNITNSFWKLLNFIPRVINRFFISKIKKNMLGSYGKKVFLGKSVKFNWKNVYIGNNVSIGEGARFICSRAKVIIGDNVMFAPNVKVVTGGHSIDIIGKYMIDITNEEKNANEDRDIIISGDNWMGTNVTILRGVIIGQGSVVGAGSVVTKNIPEYEVWAGNPAKFIKKRFTDEELIEHQTKLRIINDKG